MSLIQIDADHAVSALVEAMLPICSGENGDGLYVRLDIRGSNYDYARWNGMMMPRKRAEAEANAIIDHMPDDLDEEDYPWPEDSEASEQVHLLFFRPTNYTQVYVLRDDSWSMPTADADWKLHSDHDSCWRTDGFSFLWDVYKGLEKATTPEGAQGFTHYCRIARVNRVKMATEAVLGGVKSPKDRRRVTKLEKTGRKPLPIE